MCNFQLKKNEPFRVREVIAKMNNLRIETFERLTWPASSTAEYANWPARYISVRRSKGELQQDLWLGRDTDKVGLRLKH